MVEEPWSWCPCRGSGTIIWTNDYEQRHLCHKHSKGCNDKHIKFAMKEIHWTTTHQGHKPLRPCFSLPASKRWRINVENLHTYQNQQNKWNIWPIRSRHCYPTGADANCDPVWEQLLLHYRLLVWIFMTWCIPKACVHTMNFIVDVYKSTYRKGPHC